MALKFLNKKIFFVLGFIVLAILLVGGFFLWKELNFRPESVYTIFFDKEYANVKDFKIEDTDKGKILKDEDSGFSLKIPKEWFVKEYPDEISILSPEAELEADGSFNIDSFKSKGACGFSVQIIKTKKVSPDFLTDDEFLKKEISDLKNGKSESDKDNLKQEIISV
nr:hypothetical protein [Candidatus Paceibacterota bacterium]